MGEVISFWGSLGTIPGYLFKETLSFEIKDF